MKITGKLSADVVGLTIKRNQAHDGTEAQLDIELGADEDTCSEIYGETFKALAFSTMQVVDDPETGKQIGHLVDSIKPGKRVVCEAHEVALGDLKIRCQPQILNIKPVDGKPSAVVKIRLEIESAQVAPLVDKINKVIKVEFNPAQGELGLEGRAA